MELWIRSQDKRHLIKADYVSIMENNIINVASSGWDYDVAKYKSEERALEVLDEIETAIVYCGCDLPNEIKEIKKKIKSYFAMNLKTNSIVYEMPKE